MTALSIQTLPRWALNGSGEDLTARLSDPAQRQRDCNGYARRPPGLGRSRPDSPWRNMQIGVCRGSTNMQGRRIANLAREAGQNPIEFVLDLLAETGGNVSAVNFAIGETDIAHVMRLPLTLIGSDGSGTHPDGEANATNIHPRTYGTFPRVLGRYVRELGILTEAEAIYKMTLLPARRLGFDHERGRIAPGCYADIMIYNPETVTDCATFDHPHQFAKGIETVWSMGASPTKTARTRTLGGRVLRKNQ